MVGAKLPQGTGWAATGFVQVFTVSGAVGAYTGLREPRVQIDCWAVKPNGSSPPWGFANSLAENVIAATVNGTGQQTTVALGSHYDPARILTVRALGEPRRVPGDEGAYARYTFDLEIVWVSA